MGRGGRLVVVCFTRTNFLKGRSTQRRHSVRIPGMYHIVPNDMVRCSRTQGVWKFACYVGKDTRHTRPESGTHGMRGSKPAGFMERVSERRAHSVASAAAVALVAPLVRVLFSPATSPAHRALTVGHAGMASHSTFGAFVLLGFGTGWSLADALFGNMGTFMARLPEGLLLPTHAELVGKATIAVVLLACWAGTTLRGASPTLAQFQRLWVLYALVLGGTLVGGLAWQVTRAGRAAVVLLVLFCVAYAVGTMTVTLVLPLPLL